MYRTLKLDTKNGVATVTLSRPDSRNAMSAALMREMIACAGRIAVRRDVDVAIVRGSGSCFSAGADLKDASRWGDSAQSLDQQREIAALGYRMARAKRLTILCERVPAGDALAMGLADFLAPPGKALKVARDVAAQVLALPRNSVRMSKESVNAYASIGAHATSHMAHDQVQLAAGSAEAKAAREAFALRRDRKTSLRRKKAATPARSRARRAR